MRARPSPFPSSGLGESFCVRNASPPPTSCHVYGGGRMAYRRMSRVRRYGVDRLGETLTGYEQCANWPRSSDERHTLITRCTRPTATSELGHSRWWMSISAFQNRVFPATVRTTGHAGCEVMG